MSVVEFLVSLVLRTYNQDVTMQVLENEYGIHINSLYTSRHIQPVYEPKNYDLVYLKNNVIGQLIGDKVVIYGKHSTTPIKLLNLNVVMYGRVIKDTTKENVHIHYGHYSKYVKVKDIIKDASVEYQVPYDILATLLYNESKFDNNAVSSTGVRGIAMFTTTTAKEYGVDRNDVVSQIFGMARKLQHDFSRTNQYWSEHDRWNITSFIYNSGKGLYWEAKKLSRDKSYKSILHELNKLSKAKQGVEYIKRLNRYRNMFVVERSDSELV